MEDDNDATTLASVAQPNSCSKEKQRRKPPVLSDGSTSYRKACESCRKRKEKCSGDKPTCQRCTKLNQECIYIGRKPGSGIARPTLSRSRKPSNDGSRDEESNGSNSTVDSTTTAATPQPNIYQLKHDDVFVTSVIPPVTVACSNGRVPTLSPLPPPPFIYPRVASSATILSFRHPSSLPTTPHIDLHSQPAHVHRSHPHILSRTTTVPSSIPPADAGLQALCAPYLLDLYFRHVHPDILYSFLHPNDAFNPRKSPLLIDAMCALATVRARIAPSHPGLPSWQAGDTFWNRLETLTPDTFDRYASVETVQALLLMALYASSSDRLVLISTYFGMAVRMAQYLQIDRDMPILNIADPNFVIVESRRRTWHAIIVLDLYISCNVFPGRPPHIPDYVRKSIQPIAPEYVWEIANGGPPLVSSRSSTLPVSEVSPYDEAWRPMNALLQLQDIGRRITAHVARLFGLNNAASPNPEFSLDPLDQGDPIQSIAADDIGSSRIVRSSDSLIPLALPQLVSINASGLTRPSDTVLPPLAVSVGIPPSKSASKTASSILSIPVVLDEQSYYSELGMLDRDLVQWLDTTPLWVQNSEVLDTTFSSALYSASPPSVLAPCLMITYYGLRCGIHAPSLANSVRMKDPTLSDKSLPHAISSLKHGIRITETLLSHRPDYGHGASAITQFALYLLGLTSLIIKNLAPGMLHDCQSAEIVVLRALDTMSITNHCASKWSHMLRTLMIRFQHVLARDCGHVSSRLLTLPVPYNLKEAATRHTATRIAPIQLPMHANEHRQLPMLQSGRAMQRLYPPPPPPPFP
ncbi:hypothetical protein SeMB42_g01955 [Synchytrium endobioticum]|uniref:Zn(2)-C6 fungal-type domain-containing protein n=1 Tax=Synchytrium endobioticum TaxID=286115 RepID=A0A507DJA7_9FUNG|nr:hypothetical protein SeLEV6574_g03683 [Synchytrium endobioticum]TPX51335.1 hypothetical protein SeMB42_g01955 [Synchytrium endobioticum]